MSAIRIGDAAVLASGSVVVDGHELLEITGENFELTFAWSREDDNLIVGGSCGNIRIDLPIARPSTNTAHDLIVGDEPRRFQLRFHIAWLHERARILTYTLLRASGS